MSSSTVLGKRAHTKKQKLNRKKTKQDKKKKKKNTENKQKTTTEKKNGPINSENCFRKINSTN